MKQLSYVMTRNFYIQRNNSVYPAPTFWIRPEKVAHRAVMGNFYFSINGADLGNGGQLVT